MDNFLRYFYQDIGRVFRAFCETLSAAFNFLNYLLNFPMRMEIIESYESEFTTTDWIMLLAVNILLVLLVVLLCVGLTKLFRKAFRFRVSAKEYEAMSKQVRTLQRDLLRANYEKDKLLAMRVAELGGTSAELPEEPAEEEGEETQEESEYVPDNNRNTLTSPCVDPEESRFFRLTCVDNFYKTQYTAPTYNDEITLEDFCKQFRAFAASQLKLYYELDMMRFFVAALGTTRIVILQGISGTGKTSLPYAFGKFVQRDSSVVSVQPSWRERTELYGYFNEFSKKYTETEFLKAIYEGNYYRDPHIVILDEMNIARVEYYFAEMLSILVLKCCPFWSCRERKSIKSMW